MVHDDNACHCPCESSGRSSVTGSPTASVDSWNDTGKLTHQDSLLGVPLWHHGLRIQHCHCSGSGQCHGMGLIPGPKTSTCCRLGQKNPKASFSLEAHGCDASCQGSHLGIMRILLLGGPGQSSRAPLWLGLVWSEGLAEPGESRAGEAGRLLGRGASGLCPGAPTLLTPGLGCPKSSSGHSAFPRTSSSHCTVLCYFELGCWP